MSEINLDLKSIDASKLRISIDELKMGDNYKDVTRESTDRLKRSLLRFGQRKPILLDGREGKAGMILGGNHQHVAIAELIKESKWKYGNRVWVDIVIPVDDKDAKLYSLVDNAQYDIPTTERLAEWGAELVDYPEIDLIPIIVDYQTITLKDAYEQVAPEPEVVEDEAPEVSQEEPKSKLGEVYQLGRHKLMCGDSTRIEDVEKLMNGQKADMVFTDPPYGMFLNADFSDMKNNLDFAKDKGFVGGRKYDNVIGDNEDFNPDFINTIFAMFPNVKEVFMWGANYYSELLQNRNDGSWFVWDKRLDESADKMYGSCFELCWSKNKHKQAIVRIKWAGVFGTEQEFDHKRHHPTQKPVGLSVWFIEKFSKDSETIVDLFGGSGSTLIACEQLNRTCYMMELDEKYCDVIRKRYAKFIGKEDQWQETTPQVL